MAEPKHEETFKVIDRRHFTEEGELRKDVVEQERREEETAAKNAATHARQAPANAPEHGRSAAKESGLRGADGAVLQGAATAIAPEPDASSEDNEPSRSFQMLVDFLTRNAAAMLGGMADPRTGQPFVDLEGAREMIDMLDALREKTRGNLAKADDDLLLEVIGSLKLTFMEISKAATEAMAKKAKAKP